MTRFAMPDGVLWIKASKPLSSSFGRAVSVWFFCARAPVAPAVPSLHGQSSRPKAETLHFVRVHFAGDDSVQHIRKPDIGINAVELSCLCRVWGRIGCQFTMEPCASALSWGREIGKPGHEVNAD